jgi:LPXTG-site transpeptidase (sortase) family protein
VDVVGENTGTYRNTIPTDNVDATVLTTGKLIEPLGDASATLQVRDLEIGIVKGFNPVLVYGGATSTMTIRLINPNATALTGITFVDDMDLFYAPGQSGIILANPPDFDTGTCGGTLTALSPSSFRFQNGVLPPDFSCEMTLKVIMEQNGSRTNKIPVGAVTTFNGVTSDQPAQASLTNLPGIRVVKVFNPNPVLINEVTNLTITISNTSNVPVREMDLLDQFPNLPTGLIIKNDVADPTDDPTHTCIDPAAPIPSPATSLTATGGSQVIQLENGSLAGKGDPSGKDVCTITVKVVATSAGAFENIIKVGDVTGRDGEKNLNPGSDTLYVGNLYSLGNRVWFDTDNDGIIDTTEVGVDGVTVELYNADASGNPTGAVRRTDVTYQGGYYRFDNLEPRTDGYVVVIPASQFAAGGKLAGYWSSGSSINASGALSDGTTIDPDNDADSDENGITQTSGAFDGAVISKAIVLGPPSGSPEVGNEPTNDDDEPLVSPFGESADDYSNRTVDFGFYRTSLGNLVYLDKDGNGTYGGSPDIPIPGATVELFASDGSTEINVGPDGIWKTADDSGAGVLSDDDGNYLFSGLPAGSYVVKVTPPAAGGYSSTIDNGSAAMQNDNDTPNNNLNNNDNGDGTASGQVSSAPIPLVPGSSGAQNQNTITQATGTTHNPTMDFGFLLYSLGNRVWFDTNNDGTIDGTEVGVGGVRVQLFKADGTTEILVGADGVLGTLDDSAGGTFTNSGGYYRFDNLPEGDYVVRISNSNFTSGSLRGYWSSGTTMTSAGVLSDSTANDVDIDVDDSDENGITTFNSTSITSVNPINYVSTAPITLGGLPVEPTGETDLSGGQGTVDNHANMTADFGFYRTAIGNLVFVNAMIGGVDDGDYDDGVDNPLGGAVVTLFAGNGTTQIPTGSDGILGTGTDNNTGITTPTTGLYAFSGLPQGDYVVKVTPPTGNYTSLVDTADSTDSGNPDTNTDNNDNGIGTGLGQVNSSTGNPLTTEPGATRVGNVVTSATGTTLDNSVDFGFVSPTYSLGNRVWYDTNNNGLIDASEEGVGVVRVMLYQDNPAGVVGSYDPTDVYLTDDETDSDGYYRFDNLTAGEYIVVIPNDNFNSGGYQALTGYWSSGTARADGADGGTLSDSISPDPDLGPNGAVGGGDDDRDSDDNGRTTFSGTGAAMAINYVASSAVTLGPGETEPLNENDPTAPFWQGTGDNRANMTLDFGFYKTAIGNLTFVDNNEDGDYDAGAGGDVPLGNATLRIYSAGDAAFANPIGAAVTSNATTGVYSFDGLPQGNYVVRVTPPAGYASTIDSNPQNDNDDPDVNVDNNDNGDGLTIGANPSASAALTMNPTSEILSTSLTQDNTNGTTTDTSVDFGFTRLRYSLGNRVWFDTNNNGTMNALSDAGEVGVDGVRVRLYASNGTTEILVGADGRLGTADDGTGGMLTSGGGYYRFDNLYAGDYIVRIPGDNFRNVGAGDNVAGDPLRGYWSSGTNRANNGTVTDTFSPDPDLGLDGAAGGGDDDRDLDDNGASTFLGTTGAMTVDFVASATVTLGPDPVEPINDDDPTTDPQAGESADDQSNRTVDFGFYKTEIGNLVFEDINIDGDYDSGGATPDVLMNGVTVRLYPGNNNNSAEIRVGPDGILGTADDATGGVTTGSNGWGNGEYHFSGLPAGDYIVRVTVLPAGYTGMISTIDSSNQADNDKPDWNVDNNDNGNGEGLVTVTSETASNLTYDRLTMTPGGGTQPDNTTAKPNVTVTQATGSTTDNTLDFGFVRPYSLGNRVWFDTNNDGVLNIAAGNEGGIQGVRVELYRDNGTTVGTYDPAGSPIPDTFVAYTTTDASGYYRFDNLFPRDYIVVIPADNFRNVGGTDTVPGDPLRGYWSTGTTISGTGVINESATNDPDLLAPLDKDAFDNAASDENGRTTFSGSAINYVAAYAVTLGADGLLEPTGETNVNGQGAADDHANMTVDFGFYRVAIGNLVYYDNNVNGTYDGGDTAVVDALVHLFASNGTTEIITGADGVLGTADDGFGPDGVDDSGGNDDGDGGMPTDTNGNYLFSGLPQGDYIVKVDAPAGTVSTIDSFNQTDNDNPETHIDNNDNGDGVSGGTVTSDTTNLLVMTPGEFGVSATATTTDNTLDFGFVNLVALGNRVWFDTGAGTPANANNGRLDAGEAGVPDVTVQLYDLGPDGIANNADDNLVRTTTTSNTAGQEGYYVFDNLYPGKYYVKIPNTEFTAGELTGYVSSVGYGAVDVDNDQSGASGDENGIDGLTRTDLTTNGIITPVYTLMPNTEPSPSNLPDDVDTNYSGTLADNNVNLTADFGFVRLVAIGNRVWFDDGTGAGGVPDDGIQNGTETGVDGVRVELYRQGQVPGTDTPVAFTTTVTVGGAAGNYVFDNLVPGNYFVHIPASNFDAVAPSPLAGYVSSTGAGNNPLADEDADENGIDAVALATNGISSRVYTLTPHDAALMPTTDDEATYSGYLDDADVNFTADFGFLQKVAIGNVVWRDNGADAGTPNDGIQNGTEPGISGVDVELYRNGVDPIGTPYRTTTTDASGRYVFDNLLPGQYFVRIPQTEFAALQPLFNLLSSSDPAVPVTSETADQGVDENGIDPVSPDTAATSGIRSMLYDLQPNTEPTVDDDDTGYAGALDDDNVNYTADFGFTELVGIGNRIWFDTGADTAYGNGIQDAGEVGVPDGVRVELRLASDNSLVASTTTSSGTGFYQFNNLLPGTYYVQIPATEFDNVADALFGYVSTIGGGAAGNNADHLGVGGDENGQDAIPTVAGIRTPDYYLEPDMPLISDDDTGYVGDLDDDNVNFTADFGFYQPFSIGNRVWRDNGAATGHINNGIMDTDESPIQDVSVELYRDNGNGTFGPEDGAAIRSDITDAGGYYLFDGLAPGDYYVHIPASNFDTTGDPLYGLYNSIPTFSTDADRDDNGVNNARPDLNGISSGMVTLSKDGEPSGEEVSGNTDTTLGNDPTAGDGLESRGRYGETDRNSNLSVDFGFVPPLSLGNRVWLDNGSTPGGLVLSQFDDGVMNIGGNEPGIDGVTLSLFYDADNSGSISGAEATTPYATTTTANGGYYLFDKLPAGLYYAEVDASNFNAGNPLSGLLSSSVNFNNENTDINDNGTVAGAVIRSNNFVLNHGGEPDDESDLSTNAATYGVDNVGLFGQTDGDSNLTLDFGFISPPHSIGNRLWYDANNNGVMDGGEPPVSGALVSLYSDEDATVGTPDGAALATDVTDANGFYLFSNLPVGRYLVGVNADNFTDTGAADPYKALVGYASSVGNQTNNTDLNDNGIDRILPGDATASPYGVLSNNIDLTIATPSGETDLSNNAADGAPGYRGTHGELDADSDLTIDFGFFQPMSIGNRVFRDNGTAAGHLNNGIMDGGELPIQNVSVELYRDNGNGTFGAEDGAAIRTDNTDAGGYYLFDNLNPGNYFVRIPATEFQSGGDLFGFNNSVPDGTETVQVTGNELVHTPITDSDDNGVYNTRPDTNGITSGIIALALTTEPSNESELSGQANPGAPANAGNNPTGWDGPNSRGRYGETETNSNLTVDFGFLPVYSLGNRVWLDDGAGGGTPADGLINGSEAGIGGVTVRLYRDLDDDGTADGGIFASEPTDANGYYRFDNLVAGHYIVEVVTPLGLGSTTDANQDPDDDADNDDNGVIILPTVVRSHPITLGGATPEPSTDNFPAINPESTDGEAPNNQSNRTVDFGFVGAVALGNVVWYDTGAGAGQYNNGIFDAGETGVNGVTVNLYYDADKNNSITGAELTTPYRTTVTAGGGFYQFDQLIPGRYQVGIPATEFLGAEQLVGYTSSTGYDTDDDDHLGVSGDENGVDATSAVLTASGIRSVDYVLTVGGEPGPTDLDLEAGGSYTGTITDDSSINFTADFGFTQVVAIGNRVWLDTSAGVTYGNGRQDGGEAGAPNVTVQLFSPGADGVIGGGDDVQVGSNVVTNASGDYVFDGLKPGNYYVHIPAAEFQTGGDLIGYSSSVGQGTSQTTDQAGDENGSDNQPAVNGVSSPIYNLTLNGQPTLANSEDQSGYPGVLDDNDVNYTADFGFTRLVALGNVVWIDTGAGYNNGIYEPADENGVDGVTVNLYTSTGTFVATTTTANGGTYKFDNLLPGAYYVEIPNTNFDTATDPLFGYISSTGSGATVTADDNADENGIDPVSPNTAATSGIRSMVYNLTAGGEPDTDDETSYRSDFDTDGQPDGKLDDTSVNFTADFGFTESFSLGNRVWFDADRDGTRNGVETGLPNVTVYLYRDSLGDGTPDGSAIASTLTDANGYYRFDNLIADTYIVEVTTLVGYASTVDAGDPDLDPGDDDDNGVTLVLVGAENRVRSDPVTLEPRTNNEPQAEGNPLTNPEVGEAPDARSNRTVDFGFLASNATSRKQLTGTIVMDTDPATGNSIVGTDFTSGTQVAIGEILTYEIRLEIPSGANFVSLRAVDQLDAGLAFVDCDSVVASDPRLTTTLPGGFSAACNPDVNPTIAPQSTPEAQNDANLATFSLGDVQNATADTQTVTITYRVIVLDIPSNRDGISGLNNSASWSWVGTTLPPVSATPVEVVEPALSIDKNATPRSSEYGRNITFTIQIAHTAASSTDAFDVVVTDILPTGLRYVAGSASFAGLAPNVPTPPADYYDAATSTLTFEWDTFPLGQTSTITFSATFVGPAPVVNSANVAWTSLPIDPQPSGQPVRLSLFNDFSTERWYDPADLTGLNAYRSEDAVSITLPEDGDRGNKKAWVLPATGFAPDVVTELPPMPEGFAYAQTDILLEIPKIGQTLKIAGVPYDSEKREWNLTWLNNEAGWLETTAFPTHSGNSALTAHTTLPSGQPGPFAKLGSLSYGDQVIVRFGGQKYIFEVRENKQVKPTEVNSVLKHEEFPWLTLITCKSYNEKTGEYTYRTVVRAVLIDVVDE